MRTVCAVVVTVGLLVGSVLFGADEPRSLDETYLAQEKLLQTCRDKKISREKFVSEHNRLIVKIHHLRLNEEIRILNVNLLGNYEKDWLRAQDETRLKLKETALGVIRAAGEIFRSDEESRPLMRDIGGIYSLVGERIRSGGHVAKTSQREFGDELDGAILSKKMVLKKGGGFSGRVTTLTDADRVALIFGSLEKAEEIISAKICDHLTELEANALRSAAKAISNADNQNAFYGVPFDDGAKLDDDIVVSDEELAKELLKRQGPYSRLGRRVGPALLLAELEGDKSIGVLVKRIRKKIEKSKKVEGKGETTEGDLDPDSDLLTAYATVQKLGETREGRARLEKAKTSVMTRLIADPSSVFQRKHLSDLRQHLKDRKIMPMKARLIPVSNRKERVAAALDAALAMIHHHPVEELEPTEPGEEALRAEKLRRENVDAFGALVGARRGASEGVGGVDLSVRFNAPKLQTPECKSCVSFAILSDLETFEGVPELSKGLGYAFMSSEVHLGRARFSNNLAGQMEKVLGAKDYTELIKKVDQGANVFGSFTLLKEHPVCPEVDYPYDPKAFMPKDLSDIGNRKFGVESHASLMYYDVRVTASDLKDMLASGVSVIVDIATDARKTQEDWIRPEPVGYIAHIVNLVGYGEGIDPFDGKRKSYFLLRDSLGSLPIHYKIAMSDFLREHRNTYKVTKPKVFESSPQYEE